MLDDYSNYPDSQFRTGCGCCTDNADHCHGTLIVHSDNVVECTDDDCVELQSVRHSLVVDCIAVTGECSCTATLVTRMAS